MKRILSLTLCLAIFSIPALATESTRKKAPEGAKVYIISPKNGDTVSSPVTVKFGLKGMGVAPAGVFKANTGHHHLLIDTDKTPDMSQPISKSDKSIHFGGGQTETEVKLAPGKHTLQLLLGDLTHVPHDPPVLSEKIEITVK